MLQYRQFIPQLAVAFSLALFGCTPSGEIQKFVFPAKCVNACWMGIEPKISTADEALELLQKSYGSENVIRDDRAGVITWNADNPDWKDRGNVFIRNDMVDFILLFFHENTIEVKDLIVEIGNPDSVGLVVSGPVVKCAGASLLYPRAGLQAYLDSVDKSVGVSETQVVNGFGIYSPWETDDFPWTDTEIVSWNGYHEYCPEKWSWEK